MIPAGPRPPPTAGRPVQAAGRQRRHAPDLPGRRRYGLVRPIPNTRPGFAYTRRWPAVYPLFSMQRVQGYPSRPRIDLFHWIVHVPARTVPGLDRSLPVPELDGQNSEAHRRSHYCRQAWRASPRLSSKSTLACWRSPCACLILPKKVSISQTPQRLPSSRNNSRLCSSRDCARA